MTRRRFGSLTVVSGRSSGGMNAIGSMAGVYSMLVGGGQRTDATESQIWGCTSAFSLIGLQGNPY